MKTFPNIDESHCMLMVLMFLPELATWHAMPRRSRFCFVVLVVATCGVNNQFANFGQFHNASLDVVL
jgi:hypothetical protein